MTIVITSNADLPTCLNTWSKQDKKARQLAHLHSGIPAKKTRGPRPQGFFSRTVIVTLENGGEVVIQFRTEPLDLEPFDTARKALGVAVPEVKLIQDVKLENVCIWAYFMSCIPGKTWHEGATGKDQQFLVTTVRSLGRLLSKARIDENTALVVDRKLRPHLELFMSSEDGQIRRFHDIASDLSCKLDWLKVLPLFGSHFDLNDVNIMIDDNCEVSGTVDWELSAPLPFGMGFCRIHTLAGEFSEKKFCMPPNFDQAERGFWDEILDGIPKDVSELFHANPEAVQIAVTLGTLLDAFQLEEGKIGPYNPVVVEALPKFLTYRIPMLRDTAPPYSE